MFDRPSRLRRREKWALARVEREQRRIDRLQERLEFRQDCLELAEFKVRIAHGELEGTEGRFPTAKAELESVIRESKEWNERVQARWGTRKGKRA